LVPRGVSIKNAPLISMTIEEEYGRKKLQHAVYPTAAGLTTTITRHLAQHHVKTLTKMKLLSGNTLYA
jgi:hypothetical protein